MATPKPVRDRHELDSAIARLPMIGFPFEAKITGYPNCKDAVLRASVGSRGIAVVGVDRFYGAADEGLQQRKSMPRLRDIRCKPYPIVSANSRSTLPARH